MPMPVSRCAKCSRDRKWTKLTFDVDPSKGDGSEPEHYRFICDNDCIPTRWEAWKERRHAQKATRELTSWVQNTKDKNAC